MKNWTYLILFILLAITSCQKEHEKFERPDWLEGKLYTQLLTIPDIDSFVVCIERSGYDTIIDRSGSYTIFAPDNSAFINYMSGLYSSIQDIPEQEVLRLVKYHIIQNPWSRDQLKSLDVNGWIDIRDPSNNEPWGYKRQTLMKDENRKYWIDIYLDNAQIVDSSSAQEFRTVHSSSRKYIPLFFDEYMSLAKLSSSDFEDYFGRSYEPGQLFYANGKLGEEDYFAENGFIYKIDEVVRPLKNTEQLLESEYPDHSYKKFLQSIYLFPTFSANIEETNKQEGADEGREVPTLYDLDYNQLVFDVHEELTGRDLLDEFNSVRYHYGLLAPTDAAMNDLIDNVVTAKSGYPHWPNYSTTPENIKRIIVNSHMSSSPIYLSDLEHGFINGENDSVIFDPDDVIDKVYASNATFYGTNKVIVPRAFSSVAGPVYLRPGYEEFMLAVEYAKVLPAIKRRNAEYSFFVIPDPVFEEDSSLTMERDSRNPRKINAFSYDKSEDMRKKKRTEYEITQQILNQIGTRVPKGIARKEFIPNLGGNFILYNSEIHSETGGPTVQGSAPCVYGFNGDSVVYTTPFELEEDTDNGKTYEVDAWFSYGREGLYTKLKDYEWFRDLMIEADLIDDRFNKFKFINESEFYTVFIPSEEALMKYNTDTLSQEELEQFIRYHFIRGELIFTDGNKESADYETLRIDESSTIYKTKHSMLDIRPDIDLIGLYNTQGDHITDVVENDSLTNVMAAIDMSNINNIENYVTNSVIHVIDTVLLKR